MREHPIDMHETPESAESSVPPPSFRRRQAVMLVLLIIVLVPPVYLMCWWAFSVASNSNFGSLGMVFARWRFSDSFESQYGELLDCLERGLTRSAGAEAVAVAEACFVEAELREASPFAIHVLAPTVDGHVEWQEVRSIDNSFGMDDIHARERSNGLHLDSPRHFLGRCLLYVKTLPMQADQTGRCQAYSVLVPIAWLDRSVPIAAPR